MCHIKTGVPLPANKKTIYKRRSFLPEPDPISFPFPLDPPPTYQVSYCQEYPKKQQRQRVLHAEFTHTSIFTAIRNCVFNLQKPQSEKRRHRPQRTKEPKESVQDLIFSLKCDVQKMSKKEGEPGNVECSDPFFLLPAMMCKLNKLEDNIIKTFDCEKKLSKRKEMLITSKCIRKSILDQLRSDEKLLLEKRRKLCCLIKSLQIFERQIKFTNKNLEECCPTSVKCLALPDPCNCPPEKSDSCNPCSSPVDCPPIDCLPSTPPCASDPCEPGNYDITGLNLVYTKGNVGKDSLGRERCTVQNRVSWDMASPNDCQISIIKDGNQCDVCNDPVMKTRISHVSRIWLESARQLVETFSECPPC